MACGSHGGSGWTSSSKPSRLPPPFCWATTLFLRRQARQRWSYLVKAPFLSGTTVNTTLIPGLRVWMESGVCMCSCIREQLWANKSQDWWTFFPALVNCCVEALDFNSEFDNISGLRKTTKQDSRLHRALHFSYSFVVSEYQLGERLSLLCPGSVEASHDIFHLSIGLSSSLCYSHLTQQ